MKRIFTMLVGMTIALTPVFAANWYVSPSGNDANSGTSWDTAKKTIQAGINAASTNDTVLVANGTYVVTQQIEIKKSITVKSVYGASSTIIDGNYPNTTNRVLYVFSGDPVAVVDGFTIQNGHQKDPSPSGDPKYLEDAWGGRANGGGVRIDYGGLIRNCIIKDNYATYSGGGVYYYHMPGYFDAGGIWNCTIVNNTAGKQGGGVHAYDIPGGTIRNL